MKLSCYCDLLDLQLEITRFSGQNGRWSARIYRGEIKESRRSSILRSISGDGESPQAALDDYVMQIRGKLLVLNAGQEEKRREFNIPLSLTN